MSLNIVCYCQYMFLLKQNPLKVKDFVQIQEDKSSNYLNKLIIVGPIHLDQR
jgi:hypothetical protein